MNPVTIENLKGILVELLGVDENDITPKSSLVADLGADSLDTVEIVIACEEEYEIDITDETVENIETVADLLAAIEKEQA